MNKNTHAPTPVAQREVVYVTHVLHGAYQVNNAEGSFIALRDSRDDNRQVLASLTNGYAVQCTYVRGPKGEQVFTQATLTGIASEYTNQMGKHVILCSYEQAAKVKATEQAVDRRQASADAKSVGIAKRNAPTSEVQALSDQVAQLTNLVAQLLGGNVAPQVSAPQVSAPQPVAKVPSAKQVAAREAFAAKARERATARKVAQPVTKVAPAPQPVATAPQGGLRGKRCPSCEGPMVIGYRHVAAPDGLKVCGTCMNLDTDAIMANIAAHA